MSRLDQLYRKILLTKFFTKGWGNPSNLKRIFEMQRIMTNRDQCQHLVPSNYPIHIDKEELAGDCRIIEGHFLSPFEKFLPGIMPKEVQTAKFQMLLPTQWRGDLKPTVLHLAGTGDHYFSRRRFLLARPLLKEYGIASIILENPYYGARKPPAQLRSSLHNVSDLFVMGGALIVESAALFHWCERNGYGPLGITGISMGGHMASVAATNWPRPLSLIPCLSWTTASTVFTQGVMSGAIPWKVLEKQYTGDTFYKTEMRKYITSPDEVARGKKAFNLGKDFAKNYPQSIEDMKAYQKEYFDEVASQEKFEEVLKMNETSSADIVDSEEECTSFDSQNTALDSTESIKQGLGGTRNIVPNIGAKKSPSHAAASYSTIAMDSNKDSKKDSKKYKVSSIFNKFDFSAKSKKNSKEKDKDLKQKHLKGEVLEFMRGIMDECTHLVNFSTPVDPSLVIYVAAEQDAYVLRDKVIPMQELWPSVEVRYLKHGHITSFLFHQADFRKAIHDSLKKQIDKYHPNTIEAQEGLKPYVKPKKKAPPRIKS